MSNDKSTNNTSTEDNKKKLSPLNILIYIVCFTVIGYVGINVASCNFMIPGTIEYARTMGTLKNPSPSVCEKTQSEGLKTLLTVAGLLMAYKANSKD